MQIKSQTKELHLRFKRDFRNTSEYHQQLLPTEFPGSDANNLLYMLYSIPETRLTFTQYQNRMD